MAISDGNVGGQQFYSALQEKAMKAVSDIFKSKLYPIQYPSQGDFMWNFQNINGVFNEGTFKYISARVSPGDIRGTAKLSAAGGFPNAYSQVLNTIAFTLSAENQDKKAKASSNASFQAKTLVDNYEGLYGPITEDQMKNAGVANKQDYIINYIIGRVWSGRGTDKPLKRDEIYYARNLKDLLPEMPSSGDQIISDVINYLNIMQPVFALEDLLENGAWIIRSLKNNAQSPTDINGGMKTFDPKSKVVSANYQVKYGINTTTATINNELQNSKKSISIGMETSQSSGDNLIVRVENKSSFVTESWLTFTTGSSSKEYDMSKVDGTSKDCSVEILWSGYTMVPMSPTAWQQANNTGWYYRDVIVQAIQNGDKDVDGFKFVSRPPYNMGNLDDGGDFGMLTNLLIANYPTIKITYRNASFSRFKESWDEKVFGNIRLFGFINLGSFSKETYGSSYRQGADNSTFTVTFSASPEVVGVPQDEKQAFVIGGAVENPEKIAMVTP